MTAIPPINADAFIEALPRLVEVQDPRPTITSDIAELRASLGEEAAQIGELIGPPTRSGTIPFEPTPRQRDLVRAVLDCLRHGTWLFLIKSRQVGSSTTLLVLMLLLMLSRPGFCVLWVVPDRNYKGIRAKWKRIVNSVVAVLGDEWPGEEHDNEEQFSLYNGSRIMWVRPGIQLESAAQAGVGDTAHCAVYCEFSKWRNPEATRGAIEPSLKAARAPIIVDSTPNELIGFGLAYSTLGNRVLTGKEPKFKPFVWHWWDCPLYRSPTPARDALTPEEAALANRYGVDRYQLQWRRETIASNRRTFHLSYIEDPQRALTIQGDCVFDPEMMQRLTLRNQAGGFKPPLTRGELQAELPEKWHGDADDLIWRRCWGEFGPEHDARGRYGRGYCRIFEPPKDGWNYWIGVDGSQGLPDGDPCVAVVVGDGGRHVATIRAWCPYQEFAGVLWRIGAWYGANIAIEDADKGYGERIYALLEPHLRETDAKRDRGAHPALNEAYPHKLALWKPSRKNVPDRTQAVLDYLEPEDGEPDPVVEPDWIGEMLAMDPATGKARPESGGTDDILNAAGIAWLHRTMFLTKRGRPREDVEPMSFGTGSRGQLPY